MAGPVSISAVTEAATRIAPRAGTSIVKQTLPLTFASRADDLIRSVGSPLERDAETALQLAFDLPSAKRPRIVFVGIGRTPPKTTQSLIEQAVKRGLVPGEDIIATRYRDLRVGKNRGFVRLAPQTGADGLVLAGQGQESLFLFRGGGNLSESNLKKIAMIQGVEGATALTDLSFIERAGSKALTFERLSEAGLDLPKTISIHGPDEAVRAFDDITAGVGTRQAVLKKVNSLGGKDVHFVRSHDDIERIVAQDPEAGYVMQEYLPHARDQDVRVHMVWNREAEDFEIANSYVRNRTAFARTPNLANGGYPTNYILSPWEEHQALEAARVLAQGSSHPPLHVGLDLFPRRPITAGVIEDNARLADEVRTGVRTLDDAMAASTETAAIGEAASSAGTKGTEIVLGEGNNPVTERMVNEILLTRSQGPARFPSTHQATTGASLLTNPSLS